MVFKPCPPPTPTSSITPKHLPVMTAWGYVNVLLLSWQVSIWGWLREGGGRGGQLDADVLSPTAPQPPTPPQPQTLTCHDSTRTCERRQHPAATPLSLPHTTHHPPPPTHLSWQHEDMWTSSAFSCNPSPSPTPTTSFKHPPVMTARGHVNIIGIQLHQGGPGLVHKEGVGARPPQGLLTAHPGLQQRGQQEVLLFTDSTPHRCRGWGSPYFLYFMCFVCFLLMLCCCCFWGGWWWCFFLHVCYPTLSPPIIFFVKRSGLFKSLCFRNYHYYYYDYRHCQQQHAVCYTPPPITFFVSRAMAHAQGFFKTLCFRNYCYYYYDYIHTASSDMQCATTYLST